MISLSLKKSKGILVWLALILTGINFFRITYVSYVLPIIITIIYIALYFIYGCKIYVALFLILANDAIGQIAGFISVKYLAILFIIAELYKSKLKLKKNNLFAAILSIYMILQPLLTGLDDFSTCFGTLLPFLLLLILYNNNDNNEFFDNFFESTALIICVISIHSILSGGYNNAAYVISEYSREAQFIRHGIVGVGVGDANFSSLILCTGILSVFATRDFKTYVKIIMMIPMGIALSLTLSTSGLIGLIVVIITYNMANNSLQKRIKYFFIIILVLIVSVQLYSSLPSDFRIAAIDQYVDRMNMKYMDLISGNFSGLTNGRNDLGDFYWRYIKEEGFLRQLLGGNNLLLFSHVPHNTYIDFIIQFGFIGLIVIGSIILLRIRNIFKFTDKYNKGAIISIKCLYLFFITTISVYHGSTFAFTLFLLLIIP